MSTIAPSALMLVGEGPGDSEDLRGHPFVGPAGAVLDQALRATCVAPAWLSQEERVRGTLVPGRLADLVVLDRDPYACEPEELQQVQVVATMVAGRWVHNPPPWD